MVIKRVNPLSAAKLSGVLGVLLGLIIGACISLVMMVAGSAVSAAADRPGGALFGMLFGAGAIIILPIFYGVFMFIVGLLQAALYNVAARWMGGVEIDVA
jgi:hypothetical protein